MGAQLFDLDLLFTDINKNANRYRRHTMEHGKEYRFRILYAPVEKAQHFSVKALFPRCQELLVKCTGDDNCLICNKWNELNETQIEAMRERLKNPRFNCGVSIATLYNAVSIDMDQSYGKWAVLEANLTIHRGIINACAAAKRDAEIEGYDARSYANPLNFDIIITKNHKNQKPAYNVLGASVRREPPPEIIALLNQPPEKGGPYDLKKIAKVISLEEQASILGVNMNRTISGPTIESQNSIFAIQGQQSIQGQQPIQGQQSVQGQQPIQGQGQQLVQGQQSIQGQQPIQGQGQQPVQGQQPIQGQGQQPVQGQQSIQGQQPVQENMFPVTNLEQTKQDNFSMEDNMNDEFSIPEDFDTPIDSREIVITLEEVSQIRTMSQGKLEALKEIMNRATKQDWAIKGFAPTSTKIEEIYNELLQFLTACGGSISLPNKQKAIF